MNEKGWVIFEEMIDLELIEKMRVDIVLAYKRCRNIQMLNGIPDNNAHTVHHLIGEEPSFFNYLEETPIHEYVARYFEGEFILNSFGGAINTTDSSNYAHQIHRDVRTYSNQPLIMLNTLVMLDDFTAENGATWMLSGSHKYEEKPSQKYFYEHAKQAIGKAGSILVFNSNVWHAGGKNTSDQVRRSITPMYSKPYIKQQFDYPRIVGYENQSKLSDSMQQILGYNSRTPATLNEWYQPPEKRMYKRGQG